MKWFIILFVAAADPAAQQSTVTATTIHPVPFTSFQDCREAAARMVWMADNTPFPSADARAVKRPVIRPGFPITGTKSTADCIGVR